MSVNYDGFFEIFNRRELHYSEFIKSSGISGNIITRMRRSEYVSLESLEKICKALNTSIGDIMEFSKGDKNSEQIR